MREGGRSMPAQHFFAESPEAVGIDSARLEALFERAEREVREGLLPSAQIAVARHGKLAGMRSIGRVTCEGRPAQATNDTLYVVFSCTKAIIVGGGVAVDPGRASWLRRGAGCRHQSRSSLRTGRKTSASSSS